MPREKIPPTVMDVNGRCQVAHRAHGASDETGSATKPTRCQSDHCKRANPLIIDKANHFITESKTPCLITDLKTPRIISELKNPSRITNLKNASVISDLKKPNLITDKPYSAHFSKNSQTNSYGSSHSSLFSDGVEFYSKYRQKSNLDEHCKPRSQSDIFEHSNNFQNKLEPEFRVRAVTVCVPSSYVQRSSPKMSTCPIDHKIASAVRSLKLSPDDGDYHSEFVERQKVKRVQTEQVMSKHTLKAKMVKFQRLLETAFKLVDDGHVVEGANMVDRVIINAWMSTNIGRDLAYGLCDYLRRTGYLDIFLDFYLSDETVPSARQACGRVLEECLSAQNRRYLSSSGNRLERLINVAKQFKEGEEQRIAVSILEDAFKDSPQTNQRLIELSALDFILNACQAASGTSGDARTLRHAAQALANLSMNSDHECQQKLIDKNVPDWLFLLASSQDDVTRYYACLAVCALVANKEIETAVIKSGTLSLVEPFLLAHSPENFASCDYKHCQGQTGEWLQKLLPLLSAKRKEPRSMAAFHFAMEAGIKKNQELLIIFEQIGAIDTLKQVASLPEEVAPKFASLALEIIGEKVPYKLSQQVALWSVEDVQYWVSQIGFEQYAADFGQQKVDGDLLLLLSDVELANDIGMRSSLVRKRFMRELDSLKIAADYACLDGSDLDRFLSSIDPRFSIYTYKLLDLGIDCSTLPSLDDEILKFNCGISNAVHRQKLLVSTHGCKDVEDIELAILSKQIDVFISYRRSTGGQLASLLKVLLQLRGHKVFIDIDRLYAGKFDCSLLKNIQAAKHFVLVLTPHALDRCLDDDEGADWVQKEIACAIQHNKNVIPVLDPDFHWPDENRLPRDIRMIARFNGVRWVHEYQDACIAKMEKFISGEVNVNMLPKSTSSARPIFRPCLSYCPSTQCELEERNFWASAAPRSRSNTNERMSKSPILSPKIVLNS